MSQAGGPETSGGLARWIAADLAREAMGRLAALSAMVAIVASVLADTAPAALRVLSGASGLMGIVVLLVAGLAHWSERAQWWTIVGTLGICTPLLVATIWLDR